VRAVPDCTRAVSAEDVLAVIAHPPAPADVARRRRRVLRIRLLRRILPVTAAALMAGVIGQVAWGTIATVMAPEAHAPGDEVRMDNPTFSGESKDGSRYLVTARSGLRDPKDASKILLDAPNVTVSRGTGPATRTTARTGQFREDDLTLKLEGDVKVDNGAGYQFDFKNAVIDPTTGEVNGQGVEGEGPTGTVRSDRYTVFDQGQRMVFKGGVRGRIEGQ
jgi:lipopolysaccharide export system protein LptC